MKWLDLPSAGSLLAAAAVCVTPAAQAVDMLGDTLSFERLFPDLSTHYLDAFAPAQSIVTAGSGDTVHWTFRTDIDPGPNALVFVLPSASSYGGTDTVFDGYRITGFSHEIQAVTLQQPYAGPLTITPGFGNGPRFVTVNLNGSYGANESFTLQVTFVPEPGTVALLLAGLGVEAIAARRSVPGLHG